MEGLYLAVRAALGAPDGYILDWRPTGCQLVSAAYARLLSCPYRESVWRCEVIGPHSTHRWSEHLKVHERVGNGYRCSAVGDMTLGDLYRVEPSADQCLNPSHLHGPSAPVAECRNPDPYGLRPATREPQRCRCWAPAQHGHHCSAP